MRRSVHQRQLLRAAVAALPLLLACASAQTVISAVATKLERREPETRFGATNVEARHCVPGERPLSLESNREIQLRSGEEASDVAEGKFVLAEADATLIGSPTIRRYHYANQPLADMEISGSTRTTSVLLNDALGSVVAHTA